MYMSLQAPEAGKLHWAKPEGSVLEPGDLIARVELDDPSKVHRAEPYGGRLPVFPHNSNSLASQSIAPPNPAPPAAVGDAPSTPESPASPAAATAAAWPMAGGMERYAKRWNYVARGAMRTLTALMHGYVAPRDVYDAAWFDRDAAYASPDPVSSSSSRPSACALDSGAAPRR